MGTKEEKDELEDVETIPRAQAEKEMREAAKNVREDESSRAPQTKKQDEEEEVTPETRKQAKEELREAVRHVKEEEKKRPTGGKSR